MSLVRTIAGRSLLQRPGRTIFSVSGIAVGIATVVGIFTLDYNTVLGRSRAPGEEWQAEVSVSPSQLARYPREELEGMQGVEGVTASFQHDAALAVEGATDARRERVHLVAIEAGRGEAAGAYHVSRGRDLALGGQRREALLGEPLAERLGLTIGDGVLLGRPSRAPRKDCVEGEWRERAGRKRETPPLETFEVVGLVGREALGRKARGEVVIVDFDAGEELFSGTHIQRQFWLQYAPDFNLEQLQASLGKAYSYELKRSVIVGQAADERAFRNGVRFAGLLAMVLGLFVIFHTLSMSLLERVREIGALHALGTTRGQVARIFLAEAAVIAGLGGVAGLGGGLVLARLLLRRGVTTIGVGEPIRVFDVPWETVGPLTLVGVLIALAGSVFPLLRAKNTSTVAALRGEEAGHARGVARGFQVFAALLLAGVLPGMYFVIVPVVGDAQAELVGVIMIGVGILALFIALPLVVPSILNLVCVRLTRPFERLWPLAGRMASRSMIQSPTRVAGAVAAVALVTAGFVGLRGMTASLRSEIEVWGQQAFLNKVYVRDLPKTRFDDLAAALKEYPGVLGVEPGDARTYVPFQLVGLRVEELAGYGPCKQDPGLIESLSSGRGAIVSTRLANHGDYAIGDPVHVSTGRGSVVSFEVVAISDAYGYFPHPDERLYVVVSDRHLREEFCIDTDFVSSVSVRLDRPGTSYGTVETAVRGLFPNARGLRFEIGPWLYRWHTTDIQRDFVLFDIILGLTALLAGIGVLNGQLLAALERHKELGVLKALGTTRRQVAGTVLLEAGLVGTIGGGLGALLGWGMTPVIVRALQAISALPLPVQSAGLWHLWASLGALTVTGLASVYPIWRMNRMSALAAVRTGG